MINVFFMKSTEEDFHDFHRQRKIWASFINTLFHVDNKVILVFRLPFCCLIYHVCTFAMAPKKGNQQAATFFMKKAKNERFSYFHPVECWWIHARHFRCAFIFIFQFFFRSIHCLSFRNIIANIKSHVAKICTKKIFLLRYRTNRFIIRAICYGTGGKQEHKRSKRQWQGEQEEEHRHQKRFVVMEQDDPIFYGRNRKILMDINIGGEEVTQNKLIYHHGIELIFLH